MEPTSIAQARLHAIASHLSPAPIQDLDDAYSIAQVNPLLNTLPPTQASHPTLLIPGPIEFSDEVLQSMSHYSESHLSPQFIECFSEVLQMLRRVFQTQNLKSQPFVIAGSGTLGWDQVASNLTEPGDSALVLQTGYFGNGFADCLDTYGVNVTKLKAPFGERINLTEVEAALKKKSYKLMTVTHVDTSSGVLADIGALARLVRRVSPGTLVVVDGVCSVGAEELHFDNMLLDVVVTAPQKALGCPAGLSIVMASERAVQVFNKRKSRPAAYFASWKNWIPIMQAYEAKKPAYFATPPSQLVHALHTALRQLLQHGVNKRVQSHRDVSRKVKNAVEALGLSQVAMDPASRASTMTAIWLPEGVSAPDMVKWMSKRGLVIAGGIQKDVAQRYIRIGHMGISVMDRQRDDIDMVICALREAMYELGGGLQEQTPVYQWD